MLADIRLIDYENYPVYEGNDLGANYGYKGTGFRLWSPTADKVVLQLYKNDLIEDYDMKKDINGTWYIYIDGNLDNVSYTYKIIRNKNIVVTVDPYAKALTVNGTTGVVIDLSKTNPEGWDNDIKPPFDKPTDAIIYEMHVRDFSASPDSGIKNKRKYLAFTEINTTGPDGIKTGLSHLTELGITHIHLLPIQDFESVNELEENYDWGYTPHLIPKDIPACTLAGTYNWGYDPYHYFVPEGSYSTDPTNPAARIKEAKEMVLALHKAGIRIIMDVVYNHTFITGKSIFDMVEPGYFYRHNPDGSYSNGSGCGNETASERPMMKKLILDSLKYWITEYHIDGFRFDLMALHDIDTIKEIEKIVHNIDPSILIYGEPWAGGQSALSPDKQFVKGRQYGLSVSVYNDNIRNTIKGFPDDDSRGFATGKIGLENEIKRGVVGSIKYNDVIWDFALNPSESINYVSCHDNLTLWDKIAKSNPEDTEKTRIQMDKLCNMIILTSQGIPFIQGGEEMLRTKQGINNTYNSGDAINQIDWSRKAKYKDVFEYYKGLINLRRHHPAFRINDAENVRRNLYFIESPANTVAFVLSGKPLGDSWCNIAVVYNPNKNNINIKLPHSNWMVVVDDMHSGIEPLDKGNWKIENDNLTVPPICGMVLYSLC
ncbi:MAG: type I pullulanase [Thermoanaerobacteraceae bacterium]|nr:type I pullulanase [Thermoanaerobacteraceae bacterium]